VSSFLAGVLSGLAGAAVGSLLTVYVEQALHAAVKVRARALANAREKLRGDYLRDLARLGLGVTERSDGLGRDLAALSSEPAINSPCRCATTGASPAVATVTETVRPTSPKSSASTPAGSTDDRSAGLRDHPLLDS
jgi:hypothetical protein